MNEAEITEIMQIPVSELLKLCPDPAIAVTILSLAIQRGIEKGQAQVCENYNRAMLLRGYNEVSIQN